MKARINKFLKIAKFAHICLVTVFNHIKLVPTCKAQLMAAYNRTEPPQILACHSL